MLWLCLYFPHLPAEALGLRTERSAALAQLGPRRWLATPVEGAPAGTPLATALMLQPQLKALPRRPAAERERLRALAHAAYRYGSPVCTRILEPQSPGQLPLPLLWVEVGASLQLHQGLSSLLDGLLRDLEDLDSAAQLGIAPTRMGAALLARADVIAPAFTLRELSEALAPHPLDLLPWPEERLEGLRGVGLRRLGEVFALPRAEFARRFGDAGLLELDRICGRAPHPFQAIHLPPRFERRFEFFEEVESSEGLLFPLRRLCVELQHYLRARSSGVRSLHLRLDHAQGAHSGFEQRYPVPTRSAEHLFATLRERLQRTESPPVRGLRLSAEDFAAPAELQGDFFDDPAAALEWQQTIERLRARLGEEAVWSPACTGDHRPERASIAGDGRMAEAPARGVERPLWLLREPRAIPAPAMEPAAVERIETGWWDGVPVRRDYFSAELHGGRAWIFRDLASGQWYLHGWWA